MSLRILQVMAGAEHGGAETAFADICIALHEQGAVQHVVTRPHEPRTLRLAQAGLSVTELPFGGPVDIVTRWQMTRLIRTFQPHIVQTWMQRAAQKTPRWSPLMQCPRYKVAARLGGYYKLKHYRRTDYFVANTPGIRDYLVAEGVAAAHVRQINNFADSEAAARPASRALENTPDDAFLFLALGRLHTAKGLDTLLRALPDVPGAFLWIAGEGPERDALIALAAETGVQERVRFLGWRDDRAALFEAADACVFPSRFEPFGNVFAQAWAQRCPLVLTAADGPKQYVQNDSDALMVPVDDAAALADAMRRMRDEPDLRKRLAARGYERYLQEFTREKTVAAYLDFYRDILART